MKHKDRFLDKMIDTAFLDKLQRWECEIMRTSKEYRLCTDLFLALNESAAALNWAQLELKKLM